MSSDALLVSSLMAAYFVVVPALTYMRYERRHRLRWRRHELHAVQEQEPGGPFRDGEPVARPPRVYHGERIGAPRLVKVVAVASLVLGHMVLPGLFAGLCGLVVYGLGLVSIPGLWLAAKIYRNAFGLLRCDPESARQARRLADFAVSLNVVVVGITFLLMVAVGPDPLLVFVLGYAGISFAHAEGLRLAARAVDAARAEPLGRTEGPRWPRPVAQPGRGA